MKTEIQERLALAEAADGANLPDGLSLPEQFLADAGYCSADNVAACEPAGIEPLIAVKRDHHPPPIGPSASRNPTHCRRTRLRSSA